MSQYISKEVSDAVKVEEEQKEKSTASGLVLNAEQNKRYLLFKQRCTWAKEQRDQVRMEFDDLTYEKDYILNQKAAIAYLRPKKNDDEVRIVTGTTEKKLEVLSNEIMAMNLQPEAVAYDGDDNEIANLGQDMMDIVKRTNDMERDEDFWQHYLAELLSQRAAFFEDVVETVKQGGKTCTRIRKKLISGLRIYLGDINIPAYNFQQDQPYIVKYTRMSYDQANSLLSGFERWKYVKAGTSSDQMDPYQYRLNILEKNEVEIVELMDPISNEYEVAINGIPMFSEPTELPYEVLPDRRFNISMVTIKTTATDFAYGKPPVASAKTLQALNDETLRNLVRKFRQAIEPPLGVKGKSGYVYSKDIWESGAVTQGVSADDFSILNPENKGITQSEFSLFNLIEAKTNEFLGANNLSAGIAEQGEQTATEIQALQRNAVRNLGHIVAAFIRAKRDATYLRMYNVIENASEPIKGQFNALTGQIDNIYARYTVPEATFYNGKKGKKVIQFIDRDLDQREKEDIYAYEQKESEAGRPIRIRAINYKTLKSIPIFWNIVINSQENEGTQLSKVLFLDQLKQAQAVSQLAARPLNGDKLVDEFERKWKTRGLFQEAAPTTAQAPAQGEQLMSEIEDFERTGMGSQMTEGTRGAVQRPSLNELSRQQ